MKNLIINIILANLARILFISLAWIGVAFAVILPINQTAYFMEVAVVIDELGNVVCGALFNLVLSKKNAKYLFGYRHQTISLIVGYLKRVNELTKIGNALWWVLEKVDKDHCEKAIKEYEKRYGGIIISSY